MNHQSSMLFIKNMRHVLFVVAILLLAPVVDSAIHLDTTTATAVVSGNRQNLNVQNADDHQTSRELRKLDHFFPDVDECLNSDGTYGECDMTRMPWCREGETMICYNRRPRRDKFHRDNRQPHYYIDYEGVLCYPEEFKGCSSCSPGRFCLSENRCILEEIGYPCQKWL